MLLALILSLAFVGLLVLGGWLADKALRQPTEQWAARTAQAWETNEPAASAPAVDTDPSAVRRTSRDVPCATSRPHAARASG